MRHITVSSYASKARINWEGKIKKIKNDLWGILQENEAEVEQSAQEKISHTERFLLSVSARKGDVSHLQVGKQWLPRKEHPKRSVWGIEGVTQK